MKVRRYDVLSILHVELKGFHGNFKLFVLISGSLAGPVEVVHELQDLIAKGIVEDRVG